MLFSIEGGGFFSSSALGYSKGLSLLLLGHQTREGPMRVSPWNQYELVDPELGHHFQLASKRERVSRSCTSLICFCRASVRTKTASPPKVSPDHLSPSRQHPLHGEVDGANDKIPTLKSNLKKPISNSGVVKAIYPSSETSSDMEKRRVQWTDACGGDLVEIREFDVSSWCASEEALEDVRDQSCRCMIQ